MLRVVCKPIAGANHLGTLGMYLSAGFRVVHDGEDGTVVVRKLLGRHPRGPGRGARSSSEPGRER